MNLEGAVPQMTGQLELPLEARGEAPRNRRSGEAPTAKSGHGRFSTDRLMEEVVSWGNVVKAVNRVRQNRGSPGVDGMTVDELPAHVAKAWGLIWIQLLTGTYQPKPVLRQEIPKKGGGVRELGIPCVLDRLIQQAILQVLQPLFDPTFSEHSYGFRPGRNAHQAVLRAQKYIEEGRRWVVDIDLERFFDRVNHDVLMGRLERRIADKRLLGLIRRYLTAGVMASGVVVEREEGTPQGSPLSPLLANVLLDEVDKEMERRGHAYVRYADDGNVYVRSRRAGERVKRTLERLYAGLRLKINESKSAIAEPPGRQFLGYSFWYAQDGKVKREVGRQALGEMQRRVRRITRRSGGRSVPAVCQELGEYLRGWKEYFRLAETPRVFWWLDEWILRRLRAVQLKQWKRGCTVFRELRRRGVSPDVARRVAACTRRWWKNAGILARVALPAHEYERLGVPRLCPTPS